MPPACSRLHAFATAALLGCRTDPDAADVDRDGVLNLDDCAPNDPARFPGNPEVCDGVDNDCDRVADEELITEWFVDVDGDGHGNAERSTRTCAPDPGMVALGDDCNDVLADVFPGAPELCDDKDNNCVGGIDEARWTTDFAEGWDREAVILTGDAAVASDTPGGDRYLRLVRGRPGLQGGAWFVPRVPAERWRLRFRVRMSSIGFTPGEGLAFAFIKTDGAPVVGAGAENLGIYGADVDGWALEFDVARNGAADSQSYATHLAFQEVRGAGLLMEQSSPPTFDDGEWHAVEYTQDGAAFYVTIDGYPAWNGTVILDLGDALTMGFTAATSRDRQMLFALDDVELACPDTPDDADTSLP